METGKALAQLTQTTRARPQKVSSDVVARVLESNGFSRSVAGDEDFRSAVNAVVKMYETGRGIFLSGQAGCGKTQLMRAIMKGMGNTSARFFYCKERGDMDYIRKEDMTDGNIYIDDIGAEEIVREYGNTVDIVGDFIQKYHYRGKGRFFATTNLNSSQINDRYGGRVLDRILEMCVVFKMNGNSKRRRVVVK